MQDDIRPPQRPVRAPAPAQDAAAATPIPTPENFRTPAEVAARDNVAPESNLTTSMETPGSPASAAGRLSPADAEHTGNRTNTSGPVADGTAGSNGGRWQNLRQKLHLSWPPGKKEYIVAAVVLMLVGGGATAWAMLHDSPPPKPVVRKVVKPKPKPVAPKIVPSTLSGLPVDPSVNTRPVTGVMIENSLDSRPQSSLGQAGVVFEAIAEGGITRFLALYQDTQPNDIGPVRSARPYYIQWAMGFDAGYAHVGGSPEALNDIKAWGTKDLDQFYNAGSYRRITSRYAPHNVYTTIDNLQQLQTAKGYTSSNFKGFARKAKAEPAKVPTAKSIDIRISGPLYNVHYDYNAATNSYNRSEGGTPHMDALDNTQISPTVVVVLAVPYAIQADGKHSEYQTIGSGSAYIYQDGTVTTATWSKADLKSQITFTDAHGKPVLLNPGKTWLTAVSDLQLATSAP